MKLCWQLKQIYYLGQYLHSGIARSAKQFSLVYALRLINVLTVVTIQHLEIGAAA